MFKQTPRRVWWPSLAALMLMLATLACGGEVALTEVGEATTPPPTAEGQSKQPAQPTNTPEPTSTPIVIVVTATPQPAPTSAPPTPVPIPTSTPVRPTPTVVENTPPGSVLEVGESWQQNGVRLKLEEVRFSPSNECLTLMYNFFNDTDHDIVVTIEEQDFAAEDNLARRWRLITLSEGSTMCREDWIDELSKTVAAGDHFRIPYDAWKVSFAGFVTDTNVNEVIVTVDGLSQISGARWRIPVYH